LTFEIKLKKDRTLEDLVNILKSLGISTYTKYNNKAIYYLFSDFEMIISGKSILENKNEECLDCKFNIYCYIILLYMISYNFVNNIAFVWFP